MPLKYQAFAPKRHETFCQFIRLLAVLTAAVFAGNSMAAQVTLSNLAKTYNNSQQSVTVVTVPSPLNYTVTYAGSTTPPTNVGSYAVVATIVDPVETGSASGTLVIAKGNPTLTMSAVTAKTYGDAPFNVTAAASSGLPITKWESSDPAVASVSSSGLVTVLGAGQTSIIAISAGNTNYNLAWTARPLNVARSVSILSIGTQAVTYNGSAQGFDPSALPSGQATEINYRDISVAEPAATPLVVFQNGPDTLALSYFSAGLAASGYSGMAKYISLGGAARKIDSCDVTLVTWAGYYGGKNNDPYYRYKEWADAHPSLVVVPTPGVSIPGNSAGYPLPGDSGGYYHPVTLSFYEYENDLVTVTETYRLLTSKTVQAFIPWRPSTLADGVTPNGNNGYAFRVPFSFPDGVILPPDVWVAVSFNTNNYGTAPIGTVGPYDALNIPKTSGQQAGTTLFPTYTLLYKDWRWQNATGSNGPMLRLRALPTTATRTAPVNAATYEVKTKPAAFGADPWSASTLVINKAPYVASLGNLMQIRDGAPKPVTVGTIPSGIATSVTYGGLPGAPSALGTYPVTATSVSPNYEGQVNGSLQIGDSFTSWQTASFVGSGLPPELTTSTADADGDGLSNFLEYAANLNPLAGDNPSPVGFTHGGSTLAFTYRRNLHALDLDYAIQDSTNLADPLSWGLVTPLGETTVFDDGSTRVIRATVAAPAGQAPYFLRLRTQR
jgi:hypothetical protein